MAIWIEIHCDVRASDPPGWFEKHLAPFCWSHNTENAGIMVETSENPAKALRMAKYKAISLGWRRTRKHGWACPNCRTTNP